MCTVVHVPVVVSVVEFGFVILCCLLHEASIFVWMMAVVHRVFLGLEAQFVLLFDWL